MKTCYQKQVVKDFKGKFLVGTKTVIENNILKHLLQKWRQ
jgi:hypothetical protein